MTKKFLFLACSVILLSGALSQVLAEKPAPPLSVLNPFSGKWVGRGKGIYGPSVNKRVIHFILNSSHLFCKSTARYKPRKGENTGRLKNSFGIFSFDPDKKVILYRKFEPNGRVILYRLQRNGKNMLIFQSEGENTGGQMRLIFHLTHKNALKITRLQAPDNKNFKQIEVIRLRRVTEKEKNRFRQKKIGFQFIE
ncbi:MAG: hypothetical protein GXO69_05435 [Acidobacteria bacterium]|nr:hypothetical protein [Acidobacteriota bacterium]